MSLGVDAHELRKVEAFYKRWGADVFAFCRLFLGDDTEAETASAKVFVDFCRDLSEMPIGLEIPYRLMSFAYRAMQPCRVRPSIAPKDGDLETCILCLDCKQRAVFIMRNILGMGWERTARATELSLEEVRQHWITGMLKVRELLPREFFEARH